MMKRLSLFIIVILMLAFPLAVSADVLIEPDNSFYKRNSEQCVYLRRNFIANGANEYISVKREPGTKGEISEIKNNEIIYVEYSCLYDGDYWGLTTYVGVPGGGKTGWVKMEQLLVVYDYVSFEEDHLNEFYQYTGDFIEIKDTRAVLIWNWSGSGTGAGTIKDVNVESFFVSYAYKDEQGREWG